MAVRQILQLYRLYARMDLRWFLQDMKSCMLVIFSDLLISVSAVSGVLLLSERFSGIGGFDTWQMLFMLGFYQLAGGTLLMLFGGSNVHQISRRVGRGQVDHMLMQPIPLWMQLLCEGFIPVSGNSGALTGLVVVCCATSRLGIAVTPAWVLLLALLALVHVAIEMGASYLIAASAFYQPVACEEISSVAHDLLTTLGRFPLFGLPLPLLTTLLTVLPAGLMAWFPSRILLGQAPQVYAWLPLTVAMLLCALAQAFFRKGLKHHAKYSVGRYRDMGHR